MFNSDLTPTPEPVVTSLALGNRALRQSLYERAIVHYYAGLEENPELSGTIYPNIRIATRRYLLQRQKVDRKKVVVIGWDLAHNAAGRAHTLALIYQEFADVEIIGTTFPKNGHEIWAPIRESSIKITSITLENSKNDYKKLLNAVLANPSDIVHLSKPRISNIVVGILYKKIWDAKVIIDIDDEELAFVDAKKPLALADYIKKYDTTPPLADFAGREWTRIAVGMVKSFDGVTVANEALRSRYGGVVVRHARAQVIPERSNLSKSYARAHFGIPAQKKVIIFFGTARPHKGLVEIAKAIVETQRDDLLFLVVGDFPDQSFLTELKNITACPYIFLGIQKIESIPLIMSCADYCILFQNESSVIAQYQTPAKLSDALAQGIPILANRFPAMEMLFDAGAAIEVQGNLSDNINNMVDNARLIESLKERSADLFNREFSLRANAKHLQDVSMAPSARLLEKSHEEIIDLFEERQVSSQIDDRITNKKPLELEPPDVDIVVPVYNALDDVKLCLTSLQAYTDNYTVNVIVVNDGSDESTTQWLRMFCKEKPQFILIEHDANLGYTRAVNNGLKASSAKYVLTQNSDTIVSSGWLTGLIRCMESDANIGIVGPLSNAASWQNVPNLYDEGAFAVNSLPAHVTLAAMARAVAIASTRSYPRLPFINGFCFMIKRKLIEAIGYMDEENFPIGYGEENDYCIRAADAGFELAIADDVYVFHAKSKSFGNDRRKELSKRGSDKLKEKHTAVKFKSLLERVRQTTELDAVRQRISMVLSDTPQDHESINLLSMQVLFLLPVKGGGGGAHSVIQEVAEMRRLGVNAHVAVKIEHFEGFLLNYSDIPNAQSLFVGFDDDSILNIAEQYDVVVGTIFSSIALVKRISQCNRHILPAYYVQDYEPLFFDQGSDLWREASDSYGLMPGALLFAKTHWIINEVARNHDVQVYKVSPSIDHDVYKPQTRRQDGLIHIVAMVRPGTPRRGAARTIRVLKAIKRLYDGRVSIHIFGCLDSNKDYLALERDFTHENHGILKRPQVAELLAACDIFLDLSDYQAFGRTGLEAMACGCAVVLPIAGGADEYAVNGENSVVVDTLDEGMCVESVSSLVEDSALLNKIKLSALLTAAKYSVHMAAVSEMLLFSKHLGAHRRLFPKLDKKVAILLPSRMKDGSPSGLAYERIIIPYTNSEIRTNFRVDISDKLPLQGIADLVVIQRDLDGYSIDEIESWHKQWSETGRTLIFDIDYPFFCLCKNAMHTERLQLFISIADIVTTSDKLLAYDFPDHAGKMRVIPTILEAEYWSSQKNSATTLENRSSNPVIVGLFIESGSGDAYQSVKSAITTVKEKYGDQVIFEAVSREKHFEPDICARVGYPKSSGYINFTRWMKERIRWDISLIPVASDMPNAGDYVPAFRHFEAIGCISIASEAAVTGHITGKSKYEILVEGNYLSWVDALVNILEEKSYEFIINASVSETNDVSINDINWADILCAI